MQVYILKTTAWEHTYKDVSGLVQDETTISITQQSAEDGTLKITKIEKESVLLMTVEG